MHIRYGLTGYSFIPDPGTVAGRKAILKQYPNRKAVKLGE